MRKLIKKIHLYIGLIFALPFIIQALSGAILVYRNEINNFDIPQYQQPLDKKLASANQIYDFVKKNIQENEKISFIKMPLAPNQMVHARINNIEDKKLSREIYIDPVLATEIYHKTSQSFIGYIKKLHTDLLLESPNARNIVAIYAFALLIMAITGAIIWWPKKSGKFAERIKFNFSLKGVAFNRSLHKSLGFWSFILLLITSISAIYLALPQQSTNFINHVLKIENPAPNLRDFKVEPQAAKSDFDLQNAIQISQKQINTQNEAIKFYSINFAQKDDQPHRLNFVKNDYKQGQSMIIVLFDQYHNKVIYTQNPQDFDKAQKIIAWMHPLHAGEALGNIWQFTVFCGAIFLIIFAITGFIMWLKKPNKKL